jgi:hypothetical protein
LVTLTAEYKAGPTDVKTLTRIFNLTNVQAELSGGAVRVHVHKEGDTTRHVANVYVSAPGEGVPTVEGYTDSSGVCTLYGVKVSATPIDVRMDAFNIRAFFRINGGQWTKAISVPQIRNGVLTDLGDQPVVLPGSIRGKFVDYNNINIAIPLMNVMLFPKPLSVPAIGVQLGRQETQTIYQGPDMGEFQVDGLVPGLYYIASFGQDDPGDDQNFYAGFDLTNSTSSSNWTNNYVFNVPTDSILDISATPAQYFKVVRRGSLGGRLGVVNWNSGMSQYSNGSNVAQGTRIDLVRFRNLNTEYYSGTTARFPWTNSALYMNNYIPLPNGIVTFTNNNLQNVYVPFFNPPVVNYLKDVGGAIAYDYNQQGGSYYVKPGTQIPSGYAPVLVNLTNPSNPVFSIRSRSNDFYSQTAPFTASSQTFRIDLRTNDLTNINNYGHEWGYLARNNTTLSNLVGNVFPNTAADNFPTSSLSIQYRYVGTYWDITPGTANRGFGGVSIVNGYSGISQTYTQNATYVDATRMTYDFKWAGTDFALIPNLYAGTEWERQKFFFTAGDTETQTQKNFTGAIEGFRKIFFNGAPVYQQIPTADMDIDNLQLRFRYYLNGNYPIETPNETITLTNGQFAISNRFPVSYRNVWFGISDYLTLQPGVQSSADIRVTKNQSYRGYYLSVVYQPGIPYKPNFQNGMQNGVPYYYNNTEYVVNGSNQIQVCKLGTRTFRGTVRDRDNNILPNAVVHWRATGLTGVFNVDVEDDGSFQFTAVEVTMAPVANNVEIWSTCENLANSETLPYQVWDANPNQDGIILRNLPAGGGGGGGQGEGGGG